LAWDWKFGQIGSIMKNWLDDPKFGCTRGLKLIEEYLEIEDHMVSMKISLNIHFNFLEKY
jgi:hypothetical protein